MVEELPEHVWDALKALRLPSAKIAPGALHRLIDAGLATARTTGPALTLRGREVLVHGSPRLWRDVA